jgi:tripartite-type tricarboxylate transporter receptor subunit TctC
VSVLQEQSARTRLAEQGAEVIANSPAEFRAFIRNETERLSGVIRDANIALD